MTPAHISAQLEGKKEGPNMTTIKRAAKLDPTAHERRVRKLAEGLCDQLLTGDRRISAAIVINVLAQRYPEETAWAIGDVASRLGWIPPAAPFGEQTDD
jgi:hypothetical protein